MNLITNAAESIEKQPGFVRITTGVQYCEQKDLSASLLKTNPEPGRYVFLEVCDNGCGMSESTISRLFDPFFTTKSTGRGLGMSAVMGIMKTYSAALILESESGKGSTFRALFPVSESARQVDVYEYVAPRQEEHSDTLKPISGLVLVVDDEKSVLRTCAKMVRLCGLEVITAINGVDAIAKFQERADEIDLVLMDLTMPHMDGITASENIYHIRPNAKIILASGFNKEEIDKRVSDHPPVGFISKPYSMKELEEELRKVWQIA
jgi:CheY-like chemotaxis protein